MNERKDGHPDERTRRRSDGRHTDGRLNLNRFHRVALSSPGDHREKSRRWPLDDRRIYINERPNDRSFVRPCVRLIYRDALPGLERLIVSMSNTRSCSTSRSVVLSVGRSFCQLVDLSVGRLLSQSQGRLVVLSVVGRSVGRLLSQPPGCLCDLSFGRSVVRSAVGRFVASAAYHGSLLISRC